MPTASVLEQGRRPGPAPSGGGASRCGARRPGCSCRWRSRHAVHQVAEPGSMLEVRGRYSGLQTPTLSAPPESIRPGRRLAAGEVGPEGLFEELPEGEPLVRSPVLDLTHELVVEV